MDNQLSSNQLELSKEKKALQTIGLLALLVLCFLFSMYFSPLHTSGDQVHYTRAYRLIRGLSFPEAIATYRQVIFSYEPMHFIVSWIGSTAGIDKNVLMSALNVLLVLLAYKYLLKRGFSYGLTLLVLLTNYYFFVMFFTLEKLKIAFIFMMLFLLYGRRRIPALAILAASLFSHFQMIILVGLEVGADFLSSIRRASIPKKKLVVFGLYFACACILGAIVLLRYGSFIAAKVQFYFAFSRSQGLSSLRSVAVAFFLTYLGSDRKRSTVFFFLGLSVSILLLGSDRLNMFAYFGFLYYINPKKFISKASVATLSAYLLLKSVAYLNMIYVSGG